MATCNYVSDNVVDKRAMYAVTSPKAGVEEVLEPHIGFMCGALSGITPPGGEVLYSHFSFLRPKGR